MTGPRLVVLQSFRAPRPTSNPYLPLLLGALADEVDVRTFSWRRALLGRLDVLHLHWPELLLKSDRPAGRAARRLAVLALLARLRLTRTAVVRTVHNPAPHEAVARLDRVLLGALDAATDLTVHLTERTTSSVAPARPAVVVPHGHYRDWFPAADGTPPAPGRLLHAGLLRPYKNVDALLAAFAPGPSSWQLRIVGAPVDAGLAARVARAAELDPRLLVDLRHVDDAQLAAEVARAELVVLPYDVRGGSGAQLLALSLDRPVLVPAGAAAAELAAEVGPGWVHTYAGRLGTADLERALAAVRAPGRRARPDLAAREWAPAARRHREAYAAAVARRRGAVREAVRGAVRS